MKNIGLIILFSIVPLTMVFAQTRTVNGSGNWSNSSNWIGGNIGGAVDNDDDVVMQNNIDITIQNGESYTIATLNVSKDGSLTIDFGGTLIITGSVNVDKDFTINVDGDLIINGNLDVAKSLQLNVTGNLTVLGDVTAAKDAQIDVQGAVSIGGDFVSAKDAQVNVDGTLDVTGDLNLGPGSVILGTGNVIAGNCTGAACGDSQVMPVELIYFQANASNTLIELTWATATEENFDYFSVERSVDGKDFKEIAIVNGVGESSTRIDYDYTDEFPIEGRSYYRLRSIDFDGYTEVFEYKMVEVESVAKQFNIYPNPIEGEQFSLQTNFTVAADTQLIIYNSMGGIEMKMGVNDWLTTHYLEGLSPGAYLFRLVGSEGVVVKRVLVK